MDYASYFMFLMLLGLIMLLILMVVNRMKVKGKVLTFIIGKDKGFSFQLSRKTAGGKLADVKGSDGKELYNIDSNCVMLARYPFTPIPLFQSEIPCLIYKEDVPNPLSPSELQLVKGITSKELAAAMDEHIIDEIVKATEEGGRKDKLNWVLPGITILMILILFILVYMMRMDMSGMDSKLSDIHDFVRTQ